MSHDPFHTLAADFDPDEDLFDFAGVAREADPSAPEEDLEELFAFFREGAPADELLTVPPAPATARRPEPPASPAHAVQALPPAPAPVAEPLPPRPVAPARLAHEVRASEPVRELAPGPARFSRGVVAIAASMTLLNSVLAVVMMRGRPDGGELRAPRPEDAGRDEWQALAAPPRRESTRLPDPEAVDPVHDHPALDAAREEIARGDYPAARQRVYGLLAVIDRLDDPRRGALEADCQFLIAQSLHLEALARMGGTQ